MADTNTGGFWGTFGPTIGQFGGSIGASALGGLLTRASSTPLENQVLQGNLLAQRAALGAGRNLVGMGTNAVSQPINYWSSILSGNKGQITSALAPEISQIGQGYNTAAQTSAALNPRSGPSASFNAQLPYAQQRDVSTLMQGVRPAAANALAGAANNLISSGANALYASTAAGRDILSQQEMLRNLESKRGSDTGAGLFSLFQQYGMPALAKQFPNIFGGQAGTTDKVKNLPGSVSTGDFGQVIYG